MEMISVFIAICLAAGVGLIMHAGISPVVEIGRNILTPSRKGKLFRLGIPPIHSKETPVPPLSGRIPWRMLFLLSILLGLLVWLLLPSNRWFGILLPLLVWGGKHYFEFQQKRFLQTQIREFLLDVRLHMSLHGSLLLGLQRIGQTSQSSSPLHRALRLRLLGSSARTGLDLLRLIGQDLGSPVFTRIVQRISSAATSGGISDIDGALARAIDELNEEISYQTEEQMQQLPTRITLLAMPFLLGPIVILLFYPLVDRILQTLSGVGIGSGF